MDRWLSCSFQVELSEAKRIQDELRVLVSRRYPFRQDPVEWVAGVDVSYPVKEYACASVVVLSYPDLQVEEVVTVRDRVRFPYVPGLLSFREGPAVEEALSRLVRTPQIVFFDGQGLAHPRRFGIACHLGVIFDVVSIGVAKTALVGQCRPPGEKRGSFSWLMDRGDRVGAALRTRPGTKPVFVSPGHKISLKQAISWTMAVTGSYRIPEPTRLAHLSAGKARNSCSP